MNISFTITDKEGNEIKVSLSSFPEQSTGFLEGTELVDISLQRTKDTGTLGYPILTLLSEKICKIITDNKESVFYYYCDEINTIPNIRKGKATPPAEYRNNLFTLLYQKAKEKHPELDIEDREIIFETQDGKAYIHLIYFEQNKTKANAIEKELETISASLK